MIVSMTGFGRAEGYFKNKKYTVELKSLNSKYLEIFLKCPKFLLEKELDIREIIKDKVSRGKIYININLEDEIENLYLENIDRKIIKSYIKFLKEIKQVIGSDEKITIDHILKLHESIVKEQLIKVDKKEFSFIKSLISIALKDFILMKQKEGQFLKNDILKRIKIIAKELEKISLYSIGRIDKEREKINKNIKSIITDPKLINESRVEYEIALMAEKLDITEEVIRFKSHIKYFLDYVNSKEYSGRRLNFLLQEMNREINTISTKSLNASISQISIVIKEELEKIREQIQNIE